MHAAKILTIQLDFFSKKFPMNWTTKMNIKGFRDRVQFERLSDVTAVLGESFTPVRSGDAFSRSSDFELCTERSSQPGKDNRFRMSTCVTDPLQRTRWTSNSDHRWVCILLKRCSLILVLFDCPNFTMSSQRKAREGVKAPKAIREKKVETHEKSSIRIFILQSTGGHLDEASFDNIRYATVNFYAD